MKCVGCGQEIKSTDKSIIRDDGVFHEGCLMETAVLCPVCRLPVTETGIAITDQWYHPECQPQKD
jgi:hypothetical protein